MPPDGDLPVLTLQPDAAVVIRRADRPLVNPLALERALAAAHDQLVRRRVTGLYVGIELTAMGWAGPAVEADCRFMLDDMAGMLAAQLRRQDLLARTGELGFAVLASPVPEDQADAIHKRLSASIEAFLHEWRGRGIVACCALSKEILDAGTDIVDLAPRTRRRHTLLSDDPSDEAAA